MKVEMILMIQVKIKSQIQLFSDSSINDSLLSGVTLIQNFKEIKQPRNYTSQSFFIDKNRVNNLAKNNNKIV